MSVVARADGSDIVHRSREVVKQHSDVRSCVTDKPVIDEAGFLCGQCPDTREHRASQTSAANNLDILSITGDRIWSDDDLSTRERIGGEGHIRLLTKRVAQEETLPGRSC